MHFASLVPTDIVDSKGGICTSLWFQGCCHKDVGWTVCKGCHNPETWDISKGEIIDNGLVIEKLFEILPRPILHNLSILGGEPLMPENREDCDIIIEAVKQKFPKIKIFCWTGYTLDQLKSMNDIHINNILKNITYLIDGPFIQKDRNAKLTLRGSTNQRVYKNVKGELIDVSDTIDNS